MKNISAADVFEAAAYALVNDRCRQSYVHDIRGGLHALHTAVELLVGAAKVPGNNAALAERAASLARRTVLNHEKSLVELMNQRAPEEPSSVNVGEIVGEVLRFLRYDAAKNLIMFKPTIAPDVFVRVRAHKFRHLVLGLCSTLADDAASGTEVEVIVSRSDHRALIEIRPIASRASVMRPEELGRSADDVTSLDELLLSLTQRWAQDNGGALELLRDSNFQNTLRLYCPLSSEPEGGTPDSGETGEEDLSPNTR